MHGFLRRLKCHRPFPARWHLLCPENPRQQVSAGVQRYLWQEGKTIWNRATLPLYSLSGWKWESPWHSPSDKHIPALFFFPPSSLFIQRKVFFLPKESNAFALFIYFPWCCQRFSSPVLIHLFYCISVFIFNPLSPSVELPHSLLSAHYPFITSPLPPVILRPLLFSRSGSLPCFPGTKPPAIDVSAVTWHVRVLSRPKGGSLRQPPN